MNHFEKYQRLQINVEIHIIFCSNNVSQPFIFIFLKILILFRYLFGK